MTSSADLLTSTEASEVLAVNRRTIQRLANAGTLPIAKKSPGRTGAFLFTRADVERLRDELAARADS